MEQALHNRDEQYCLLLHHLHVGVIVHDPDGRIVLTNPQASALLCLSEDRLKDKSSTDVDWFVVDEQEARMRVEDYPTNRVIVTGQPVQNVILGVKRPGVGGYIWLLVNAFPEFDGMGRLEQVVATFMDISDQRALEQQRREHERVVRRSLEESIRAMAATVELRDPYTAGHQRRVAHLCVCLARELGLGEDRTRGLDLAAAIHDMGKIQIPAEILNKPGRLTPPEMEIVKGHARAGYEIVKDVHFPWPIAQIILQHHERLDGSGYPEGLKEGQILIESKVLAVADVVESMTSHRPFRPARGSAQALEEIVRGRGIQYDPAAVDLCVSLFERGYCFPN